MQRKCVLPRVMFKASVFHRVQAATTDAIDGCIDFRTFHRELNGPIPAHRPSHYCAAARTGERPQMQINELNNAAPTIVRPVSQSRIAFKPSCSSQVAGLSE